MCSDAPEKDQGSRSLVYHRRRGGSSQSSQARQIDHSRKHNLSGNDARNRTTHIGKISRKVGRDFFLACSPERVDPGNNAFTSRNIPKVIGGMTPRCTAIAVLLYPQFLERTVPVSSPESAEMVKLLENTFRSVNIALANEMARMCRKI